MRLMERNITYIDVNLLIFEEKYAVIVFIRRMNTRSVMMWN